MANAHGRIREIEKQWEHQDLRCIAFGYSPVNDRFFDLFQNHGLLRDRVLHLVYDAPPAHSPGDGLAGSASLESFTTSHLLDNSNSFSVRPGESPDLDHRFAADDSMRGPLAAPPLPPAQPAPDDGHSESSFTASASVVIVHTAAAEEPPVEETPETPEMSEVFRFLQEGNNMALSQLATPESHTEELSNLTVASEPPLELLEPLPVTVDTPGAATTASEAGEVTRPAPSIPVSKSIPDKLSALKPAKKKKKKSSKNGDLLRSWHKKQHSNRHYLSPTDVDPLLEHKSLQGKQIFVGMVAVRDQPKKEVTHLAENLMNAGIRFVYFAKTDQRKTQAFGSRIGLFTDFNVWIPLKDPDVHHEEEAAEATVGVSKLPKGVSNIRRHIEEVDNVPLLISLFTDCTPPTTKEMIRIYQENGESVFAMGSSLKADNWATFLQADISVSLDPFPSKDCTFSTHNTFSRSRKPVPYSVSFEFAAAKALNTLPCTLPLPATTDLQQLSAYVCESRRLLANMQQVLLFALSCHLCLFLLLVLCAVLDCPPILNGYQVLWLSWVIVPLLSMSLLASKRSPVLMRQIAPKNQDHIKACSRFVMYFLVRVMPLGLIYVLFTLALLHRQHPSDEPSVWDHYYWGPNSGSVLADSEPWQDRLLAAQNAGLVVFVVLLAGLSMFFANRTIGIRRVNPFRNPAWIAACLSSCALQASFCAVSLSSTGAFLDVTNSSWYLVLGAVVLAVPVFVLNELAKHHDRRKCEHATQRARLEFETVLGMHSPQ